MRAERRPRLRLPPGAAVTSSRRSSVRSAERAVPARMCRVAIVAPDRRLRKALALVADAGVVELAGTFPAAEGTELDALRRLERSAGLDGRVEPRLGATPADPEELERLGRRDLLAGEVELERRAAGALRHGRYGALVGWAPQAAVEQLSARL